MKIYNLIELNGKSLCLKLGTCAQISFNQSTVKEYLPVNILTWQGIVNTVSSLWI